MLAIRAVSHPGRFSWRRLRTAPGGGEGVWGKRTVVRVCMSRGRLVGCGVCYGGRGSRGSRGGC